MDVVGARSAWCRGLPNGLSAHTSRGYRRQADSATSQLPVAGLDVHAASIPLAVVREDELLDDRTLLSTASW